MSSSAVVGILRVLLQANSAEFEEGLQKSETATKKFSGQLTAIGRQAAETGTAFTKAQQPLISTGAILTGVVAGAAATVTGRLLNLGSSIAAFGAESAARGAQLEQLSSSFTKLAGSGDQAQVMLAAMRRGTAGLTDDMALMQAGNKAMLLGLGLSGQQMGDLARTATVLGRAMGQDATKSLDDLIVALGRSSPLILDNLGLSVKLGEAHEQYAASIGKSVSALTDAEKKQAFMTAAMAAAKTKVAELGDVQLTATEHATKLWTSFRNLADATANMVVQNGPVNSQLNLLSDSVKTLEIAMRDGLTAAHAYKAGVQDLEVPAAKASEGFNALAKGFEGVGLSGDALFDALKGTKEELEAANKRVKEAEELTRARDALFGRDHIERGRLLAAAIGNVSNVTKLTTSAKQELAQAVRRAMEAYKALGETAPASMTRILDATREVLAAKPFVFDHVPFKASVQDAGASIHNLWTQSIQDTAEAQAELERFAFKFGAVLAPSVSSTLQAVPSASAWQQAWGGMSDGLEGVLDRLPNLLSNAFTGGGGVIGAVKAVGVQIADAIAQPIMQSLSRVQLAAVGAGATAAAAFGGSQQGSVGATVAGLASGIGGAALAASSLGTALAGAGVAGTVALGAMTFGIGAAAVGVVALIKHWSGVSREEKEARAEVQRFEEAVWSSLSASQRAEAGGERWKMTVIGVRDAYLAAGLSAAEAEADVARLWASSKEGGEETWRVLEEMQEKIRGVGKAAGQAAADTAESTAQTGRVTAEAVQEAQSRAMALMSQAAETGSEEAKLAAAVAIQEAERLAEELRKTLDGVATDGESAVVKLGRAIDRLPDVVDIEFRGHYRAPDLPREGLAMDLARDRNTGPNAFDLIGDGARFSNSTAAVAFDRGMDSILPSHQTSYSGGNVYVTVDAKDSFWDGVSASKLADRVAVAVEQKMMIGRRVPAFGGTR